MEIIFEIIGELIFEGLIEYVTSSKCNKYFRVLICLLLGLFFLAIGGSLLYLSFKVWVDQKWVSFIFGLGGLGCIIFYLQMIYKIYIKKNEAEEI